MKVVDILKKDYQALRYSKEEPSFMKMLLFALTDYSFRITIRLRLSNHLYMRNWLLKAFGKLLYWQNLRRSVDINPNAQIGPGLRLAHPVAITIGEQVKVGAFAHILQNVTIGGNSGKKVESEDGTLIMPVIGNFVRIGAGAVVAGPIKIGNHVIIGANAVVMINVENYCTVAGVPATLTHKGDSPHSLGLSRIFKQ